MAFKFKNLMINVAPTGSGDRAEALAVGCGLTCLHFSCQIFTCAQFTCFRTCPNFSFVTIRATFETDAVVAAGAVANEPRCFGFTCGGFTGLGPCLHNTLICPAGTICLCTHLGSFPFACLAATRPEFPGDPSDPVEQLTALRTQLQAALAEVDRQQTAVEDSQKPQSLEEVEQIQSTMREAMAELDKRKQELQKKNG